jgi:WD40 repeat protein
MKRFIYTIFLISILIYGCGPVTPFSTYEIAPVSSGTDVPVVLSNVLGTHPELEVITPENIAQLKEVDQWGIGEVNDVALSPDGNIIAVAATSGVHLFDRRTLKELNISFVDAFLITYPYRTNFGFTPPVSISSVDFDSTNDILAVGTQSSVYFWNLKDGLIESELGGAVGGFSIGKILYSPDDKTILVESNGYSSYCDGHTGFFSLYSVKYGSLIYNQIYCSDLALYHSSGFLSDGFLFLLFEEYDSELMDWYQKIVKVDPLTGNLEKVSPANDIFVYSLSLDGNLISKEYGVKPVGSNFLDFKSQRALGFIEGTVEYQSLSGRRLVSTSGHWEWLDESGAVLCNLDFPPEYFNDDESIAISWYGWDQPVKIFNMENCEVENNLFLPSGSSKPIFSPDNKFLAIGGASYIHLLETERGKYVYSLYGESINQFAFVPDQDGILSGANNGASYFLRLSSYTGNLIQKIEGKGKYPQNISVSGDGKKAAILDADGFGLWSIPLSDDPYYQTQDLSSFNLSDVQFSPDSTEVALGLHMQDGNKVLFLNSDTGQIRREFVELDYWQIDFSPDWKSFAMADSAGYITIRDLVENKELVKLSGFNKINQKDSLVNTLEYNAAGNIIASSKNGILRFWALPSGHFLGELETGMDHVYGLAFSNDGKLMIITGADGIVHVWGVSKDK